MPLTAHDAEERSRQLIGAVIDARETFAEVRSPENADRLINRQSELIAELTEQVRLAITPDPTNEENRQLRNLYITYVNGVAANAGIPLPYDRWLAVAEEANR